MPHAFLWFMFHNHSLGNTNSGFLNYLLKWVIKCGPSAINVYPINELCNGWSTCRMSNVYKRILVGYQRLSDLYEIIFVDYQRFSKKHLTIQSKLRIIFVKKNTYNQRKARQTKV